MVWCGVGWCGVVWCGEVCINLHTYVHMYKFVTSQVISCSRYHCWSLLCFQVFQAVSAFCSEGDIGSLEEECATKQGCQSRTRRRRGV